MIKFSLFILSIILILNVNQTYGQPLFNAFQNINEDALKNSKGYDYLKKLTSEIGHRYTGSENAKSGEGFVYSLFKSLGMDEVKYQEFEFPSAIRFKITFGWYYQSVFRNIQTIKASSFTPVTDIMHISNRIIDVGNGLEEDYERLGKQVKNKILLINAGIITTDTSLRNISIREKTDLAVINKADAIIFIDENPNGSIHSGKFPKGEEYPIPVFNISNKDGDSLRKNIQAKFKYRTVLEINNYKGMVKARNIIGTLKGTEFPNEYIIIGGHLDSWDIGTGAMDNGLGSMETIDIARSFTSLKLNHKRTIIFINFMGEEQFLYGSRTYVKMLKDSNLLKNVRVYINLVKSGNPVGYNTSADAFKSVLDSVGEIFNKIDPDYKNNNKVSMKTGSDHQPFMLYGVPVVVPVSMLNLKREDCHHRDCDRFDIINKQDMVNNNCFTTMLLYYFANIKSIPPQMTQDQTKAQLLKLKLKESLIFMGDWRWDN